MDRDFRTADYPRICPLVQITHSQMVVFSH
jgi:hypothetical protein